MVLYDAGTGEIWLGWLWFYTGIFCTQAMSFLTDHSCSMEL